MTRQHFHFGEEEGIPICGRKNIICRNEEEEAMAHYLDGKYHTDLKIPRSEEAWKAYKIYSNETKGLAVLLREFGYPLSAIAKVLNLKNASIVCGWVKEKRHKALCDSRGRTHENFCRDQSKNMATVDEKV